MSISRSIGIADVHRPFHNKRAYDCFLTVLEALKPNELFLNGDYADFWNLGRYKKDHSKVMMDLKDERQDVCYGLKELNHIAPQARKIFIEGNHEYRLTNYLLDNPNILVDVDTTEKLLTPEQYNFEFIPYEPDQKHHILGMRDVIARHEPKGGGVTFTNTTIKTWGVSCFVGHVHRAQAMNFINAHNETVWGIGMGWMGDSTKHREVFKYVKGFYQWSMGFVVINKWYDEWSYQLVEIKYDEKRDVYWCCVDGQIYHN